MRPFLLFAAALYLSVASLAIPSEPAVLPLHQSQRLESYVGKYPSDLFKGVPAIKQRLKSLLGPNYGFFMNRIQTEMPIENDEGALVVRGCMAHNCGIEESIMVINLADGKLHCAIRSAKFGGKFKVFSEDKAHIPAALNRAMQQ